MKAELLTLTFLAAASTAQAQDMSSHIGHDMSGHDMADMAMEKPMPDHMMIGALGGYDLTREASGTSWQPDAARHGGVHAMYGGWMFMGHALLNGVYDWQSGPRGDEKTFLAGMVMGSARKDMGRGVINLRAMLSPDPFMGKSGYPLLLAAGETADGATELTDRQHPHDLVMELSASYAFKFNDRDSAFIYAGLPGEPAFGPPAFMHRTAALDSPEAPITHHWLDSTHITFGVLTAGYVHDAWKIEASRFKGREPDENRFDIETPKLDSTAIRLTWNPSPNWSLQGSWADMKSPEQLAPNEDETRYSVSALYARPVFANGLASATFAWGRKDGHHGAQDAWLAEAALSPDDAWTIFTRAEHIETSAFSAETENVAKLSLGAIHDWRVAEHAKLGLGGLYAFNWLPDALEPAYDGDPVGAMAFVRLKLE